MNKLLTLCCMLFSFLVIAQTNPEKILNGKVMADFGELNGIYVTNLKNKKVTVTENGGFFTIPTSVGDTIILSSINFKAKKIKLEEKDFQKSLFFVKLQPIMNQLKEVFINQYNQINAEAMGIIPKGQKTFTPAERKLNTASNLYMDFKFGLTFTADPMLNAISGRTAMLEKIVEVEKKEISIAKTEAFFDENYFTEKLKIPTEYVKGFKFFIVEDQEYVAAIKNKNRTLAKFRMNELAIKYIDLITEKKF